MEAILLLKDTLDVKVLYDSLSAGKLYLVNDSATVCKTCMGNVGLGNDSAVFITGIICITVILLTCIIVGLLFYHKRKLESKKASEEKEKQVAEDKRKALEERLRVEEERSFYRKMLFNYLEHRGKEGEYVTELKSFINGFKPTE